MLEVLVGGTSKTNSVLTWERGMEGVTSPRLGHEALGGDMMGRGNRTLAFLPLTSGSKKKYYPSTRITVLSESPL